MQQKLQKLIRCVDRIKSQNISTLQDLDASLDKQEIIILNLQRAVQICIDIGNHILIDYSAIPATMADTFKAMGEKGLITKACADNLIKMVSFRNIAVNRFEKINNTIILSVIKEHLTDFTDFAESVSKL